MAKKVLSSGKATDGSHFEITDGYLLNSDYVMLQLEGVQFETAVGEGPRERLVRLRIHKTMAAEMGLIPK